MFIAARCRIPILRQSLILYAAFFKSKNLYVHDACRELKNQSEIQNLMNLKIFIKKSVFKLILTPLNMSKTDKCYYHGPVGNSKF